MFRRIKELFNVKAPSLEEERQEFAVNVIHEHTNHVLSSLARPYENDWTEATRATVMGYVVGSTYEYAFLTPEARQEAALDVIKRFGDTKLDLVLFNAELARYAAEASKYYELGLEAAKCDNLAGRKGDLVFAFMEAVRYPDEKTFRVEDLRY